MHCVNIFITGLYLGGISDQIEAGNFVKAIRSGIELPTMWINL